MKEIMIIPAKEMKEENCINEQRRRACVYARVSTDKEEQLTSYEAQVDYYTKLINSNPELEFVGVYTDEGISATSTVHRKGFNKMISDALDGNIDIIYTKSVSRFARNTVDSLLTIRKLKDVGCEVFFEKENIYTFDSKGELLITIMSSLAQEESRSISENITWAVRKRFSDGKYCIHYKEFLGYEKGEKDEPIINEKEAIIVKRIYLMFLEGLSIYEITKVLINEKINTPMGKSTWYYSVIKSILQNEKYIGNAILQKTYSTSFLTKKRKKNEGEVPKYYVKGGHPRIINDEIFFEVQEKMKKKEKSRFARGDKEYSKRVMCGECGNWYCETSWRKKEKVIKKWRCNKKVFNKCNTPYLLSSEIKKIFEDGTNYIIKNELLLKRVIKSFETDKKVLDYYLLEIEELKKYMKYNPSIVEKRIVLLREIIDKKVRLNEMLSSLDEMKIEEIIAKITGMKLIDNLIDYIKIYDKMHFIVIYHGNEKYEIYK